MSAATVRPRALGAARGLAAITLGASAAIAPASAGAKAKAKVPTEIAVLGGGVADGDFAVFGALASPRKKCRGDREVVLLAKRSGPYEPADPARSSAGGGWLLLAPITDDLQTLRVKVRRKKLRSGVVCKSAAKPVVLS